MLYFKNEVPVKIYNVAVYVTKCAILKKKILQVHMHKKKFLHKTIVHVQWAGKNILARCSLS